MSAYARLKARAQKALNALPQQGKIMVLRGGESGEREVSLASGHFVYEALRKNGAEVIDFVIDKWSDVPSRIVKDQPDKVLNLLHGTGGEDGQMQYLLSAMGIPYAGSQGRSCLLAMDKMISKMIWREQGLITPHAYYAHGVADIKWQHPIVIKPVAEGSSIGLHLIRSQTELEAVLPQIDFSQPMMVEDLVEGVELTVGILDGEALPAIEIKSASGVYDYHAKYLADDTQFITPPPWLSEERHERLKATALRAFNAFNCEQWGRVDFMQDAQGQDWLIEVNLIPGMTDHSLVPMAAKQAGLSFADICALLVQGIDEKC